MTCGCETLTYLTTPKPVANSCYRGAISTIKPKLIDLTLPPLGIETTEELGNSIIYRSKIYDFSAIVLSQPVSANGANAGVIFTLTAPSGKFKVEGKDNRGIFYRSPTRITMYVKNVEDDKESILELRGGIVVPEADSGKTQIYWYDTDMPGIALSIDGNFTYISTKHSDIIPDQLIKELVYNGRSNETVKFMYREFKDNLARPAFTQEVTYDLQIGDEIGFKGARFKILEANNTQIKYIAIKNFN